jgi:hypothetical protein
MSTFTFNYNGQPIKISGPPGATEAQARAIFQQQVNSGALVGLQSGDRIGSAQQAVGGVPGAGAALEQAASGVPGSTRGALGTAFSTVGKSFVSAGIGQTPVAAQLLKNITQSTQGLVPTNGITTADFAKTEPALTPIQGLSTNDVRATVAQAAAISGQAPAQVTNDGVGRYSLDGAQLERAGLIKPGTVNTYLASNTNSLTDVVKSPTVWTGKDGINSLDSFLSSPRAQSTAQQNLMSSGLSTVQQLGIPVASLPAKALGGLSLNAARSPEQTMAWAQGQLPADAKAQFDAAARDGAFAVGTADQKLNNAMTQQAPPGEAENTVNRQTLDAASTRVVGNDKIPSTQYTKRPLDLQLLELKVAEDDKNLAQQELILAETKQYVTASTAAQGISILETAQGIVGNIKTRALGYEREANALNSQTPGVADALLTKISTLKSEAFDLVLKIKAAIEKLKTL